VKHSKGKPKSSTSAALVVFSAGIGIPLLAALNAALGQRLGSPVAAGLVLFMVALAATGMVFLYSGASLGGVTKAPPHLFLAGTLVAFYVLTITWIAPTFGVGNAVFFVLVGQLVSAALIDHFGLFGAPVHPLSAARAGGIAVMAAGVLMTQIASRA